MQRHLRAAYFERHGRRLSNTDLSEAVSLLIEKATAGPVCDVFVRIGHTEDGIVLDLGRDDGQVVLVNPGGWQVISDSPVKLRRPNGMLPLPLPAERHENLRVELRSIVGDIDLEYQALVAAWLLGALNPKIPLPVLGITGPHGSGKSGRSKAIRECIDPNFAPLRRLPQDARDLFIAASNSAVLCVENVSHLPAWLSDGFCSIATGGGYATRKLYSDEEEALFQVRRPIMINSISDVMDRADLRDRAITISLPPIGDADRKLEGECLRQVAEAQPKVLSALLDCAGAALACGDSIRPDRLPRMADFYAFVHAAACGSDSFGFTPEEFEAAYWANRDRSRAQAIDTSPSGRPLIDLVTAMKVWSGTLSQLLSVLSSRNPLKKRVEDGWPRSPEALRHQLDRIEPELREMGISLEYSRDNSRANNRIVTLRLNR